MNLLILTSDFLPAWGGVGTYVQSLVRNMPEEIQVHVVAPKRIKFNNEDSNIIEPEEISSEKIHLHYISEAKDTFIYNFNFQINCCKKIEHLVKTFDIDLIHSQSSMPDLFISPKKIGIPIITTIHTTVEDQADTIRSSGSKFNQLEFSEKMTLLLNYFNKLVEDRYYTNERNYITVSNWAKGQIIQKKKINQSKIKVIHNGVDPLIFSPQRKDKSSYYFPELKDISSPKILFFSRMIESKGLTIFLKFMKNIIRDMDVHFILAGPGKKPIIDIPKDNYTIFGYIPHQLSNYLYSASDIFILPSFSENFPMSILEAMASECAVVASNVGGIPEMITNGYDGLLIPSKNPEIIKESVKFLIEDEKSRITIGKNARNTAKDKFGINSTVSETINYYHSVLGKVKRL
jgi:glycosyltransferase involved in cell wall biosynthesis